MKPRKEELPAIIIEFKIFNKRIEKEKTKDEQKRTGNGIA